MQDLRKKALRTSIVSIVGNLFLAILKGSVGIAGNSFALIADAIESAGDVLASVLVYLGLRISTRPADKEHPFGHGKVEPLFTFVVVLFLIVAATFIAVRAVTNIQSPQVMPAPYTLIVLAGVILYKELFYRFVARKSKQTGSGSLKADAWHHRSDAITSLAALIGIGLALLLGKGYENLDDWAALVASVIIVVNAYRIFRPALGELLDEQNHEVFIGKIRLVAENMDGVMNTEKCFVRKFGMKYNVDIHIRVDGAMSVYQGHDIAHRVKDELIQHFPQIHDVFTHVEPK